MTRQGFDNYMPNERNPSACACAEEEEDARYYAQDMRGSAVRLYGGSGGKYTLMTVIIVALVALLLGYLCKWADIPMRFFSREGRAGMADMPSQ